MKKVLIADKMSIQAEKVFTANGINFDKKTGLSEDEICKIVNEYEGIVVRSATKITKKIRSCTSICLKIKESILKKYETDNLKDKMNNVFSFLEETQIAYDINSYRDAPIGIRIWGGATVNERDIDILLDWLEWCFIKFIKE